MWDATFRKIMQAIVIAAVLIALISLAGVVVTALYLYVAAGTVPEKLEIAAFGVITSFLTLLGTMVKSAAGSLWGPSDPPAA